MVVTKEAKCDSSKVIQVVTTTIAGSKMVSSESVCVCVCVRTCACARVRAHVCVRTCACLVCARLSSVCT